MGGDFAGSRHGVERGDLYKLDQRTHAKATGIKTAYGVNRLLEQDEQARKLLALASSKDALSQRGAITSIVKTMFDSRPSDAEREFVMEGAGKWEAIKNKYNSIAAGGQITPEFLRQAQAFAREALALSSQMRARAAKAAYQAVKYSSYVESFPPEIANREAELAAAFASGVDISGQLESENRAQRQSAAEPEKKVQPKAPNKRGSAAASRAEELMGEL